MITVPIRDQISAVRREIAMRERVYPRWIATHRLTERTAERELAAMRAVLATLERVASSMDDGK